MMLMNKYISCANGDYLSSIDKEWPAFDNTSISLLSIEFVSSNNLGSRSSKALMSEGKMLITA